jgi:hypothetical protein
MKRLRMTCDSALRLARWRWMNAERRAAEDRLRFTWLEERVAALSARLQWRDGAPDESPAESLVLWMLAGLIVVGAVAVTSLVMVLLMWGN